jgi:hypothetical protein
MTHGTNKEDKEEGREGKVRQTRSCVEAAQSNTRAALIIISLFFCVLPACSTYVDHIPLTALHVKG